MSPVAKNNTRFFLTRLLVEHTNINSVDGEPNVIFVPTIFISREITRIEYQNKTFLPRGYVEAYKDRDIFVTVQQGQDIFVTVH